MLGQFTEDVASGKALTFLRHEKQSMVKCHFLGVKREVGLMNDGYFHSNNWLYYTEDTGCLQNPEPSTLSWVALASNIFLIAYWLHITSKLNGTYARVFWKRQVIKPPGTAYCVRFSLFMFPCLWHFHRSNQSPFPLNLSTMEIENSCSPTLWIMVSLCKSCQQFL